MRGGADGVDGVPKSLCEIKTLSITPFPWKCHCCRNHGQRTPVSQWPPLPLIIIIDEIFLYASLN